MKKLTLKQMRFVDEILADPSLNATNAAKKAGYSEKSAAKIGHQLLEKTRIKAAIKEAMDRRSKRTEITQDMVLREFARIAFVDPRKFFDEDGKLIPISDLDEDTAKALSGMDYHAEWENSQDDKDSLKEVMGSTTKIKLIDKKGALDSLGKHLGMFIDRKEVGRPGDFKNLTEEQLDQRIREEAELLGYVPGKAIQAGPEQTGKLPPIH